MLSHTVAGPFDLNDDGVMEKAVQEGCRDDLISEDVAPFGEATVRGEDHSTTLIACVDQLEEEIASARGDGQVSDLVDDQQRGAAQISDSFAQSALAFGLRKGSDELGERNKINTTPSADRLNG
jgi:hypothetical protein